VDAFSAIKEGKELNMDDQNALNSIIQITMKEVTTSNGIPFGSPTDKYQGLSDGNNGVQWNVGIEKTTCTIRFGINLEGKKYLDWPILRFIERELMNNDILKLLKSLNNDRIMIGLYRDAWQVRTRLDIEEKIISGNEIKAIEIDLFQWEKMLKESLECLDNRKKYRGRASQIVTLKSGEKRMMQVSPHLAIFIAIPFDELENQNRIVKYLFTIKGELHPIYKKLKEIVEL
jgi:hypothetical protein